MTLADLEAGFAHVAAERTHHRDQALGIVACAEALAAARLGNYGVGAVLVSAAVMGLRATAARTAYA